MGQYHYPVNLDKREFINPHKLGSGLKLWEQLANNPGIGAALIVLTAASNGRGGGDLDVENNWHGVERDFSNPSHHCGPGPTIQGYPETAAEVIGRWAGDRIAIIGDYAEVNDLPEEFRADLIYALCSDPEDYLTEDGHLRAWCRKEGISQEDFFTDISDAVGKVIAHELQGEFVEQSWGGREWESRRR